MLSAGAAIAALSGAAHAQSDSDFQAWSALFFTGKPAEDSRLLLWFDGHARFNDDASDLGVSIIRPGLGWRVSDKVDLWAGYARVVSRSDAAPDVEENRIWQQATYPVSTLFGGALTGRTRLEQRFRETGDDTGWRVRQFVRWERRFEGSPLSPVIANELFVNVNDADWGQQSGFDQNRLFAGGAWRVSKNVRLEGGYLHNRLNTAGPGGQTNHNVFFNLFLSL
jgi:hypothetical protein